MLSGAPLPSWTNTDQKVFLDTTWTLRCLGFAGQPDLPDLHVQQPDVHSKRRRTTAQQEGPLEDRGPVVLPTGQTESDVWSLWTDGSSSGQTGVKAGDPRDVTAPLAGWDTVKRDTVDCETPSEELFAVGKTTVTQPHRVSGPSPRARKEPAARSNGATCEPRQQCGSQASLIPRYTDPAFTVPLK
ncbi:hypothetical protein GN956_G22263 [Arapaima gigas]